MKRYISTAVYSLAFLTAIPGVQANATSVETSGGMVRNHLEAQSKLENQPSTDVQIPTQQPKEAFKQERNQSEKGGQANKPDAKLNSAYPAYCETLSPWIEPGDFEYSEALYKCKYGT